MRTAGLNEKSGMHAKPAENEFEAHLMLKSRKTFDFYTTAVSEDLTVSLDDSSSLKEEALVCLSFLM